MIPSNPITQIEAEAITPMIDRWKPSENNNSLTETLFDDIWRPFQNHNLALDIDESADGYTVQASLPGMRASNIHISIHDNVLTIHGEMKAERERRDSSCRTIMRERRAGKFSRSVRLQQPVDADDAQAEYEDGILTLWLPKGQSDADGRVSVYVE
jgi:HSP20 family protein